MPPLIGSAAALVVAASVSFAVTPLVRRLAVRLGVLDLPGSRKVHTAPVPRFGGLAVAVAVAASAALVWAWPLTRWGGAPSLLLAAAMAVHLTGLVDDVRGLSAGAKLAAEAAAALVAAAALGGVSEIQFLPVFSSVSVGHPGLLVGALWIVTITNALNMLDVADGVAGGVGAVGALALGTVGLLVGQGPEALLMFILGGALIGFLPHNVRHSRIFLGDSGSLLVGFLLGAGSLAVARRGGTVLFLPAVLALGLPLAEIALTVTRRTLSALTIVRPGSERERFLLRRGRAGLFVPDKRHVPHRLMDLGLAPRTALAALYATAVGLGVLAALSVSWPRFGLFAAVTVSAASVYGAPRWLYEEMRLLDRGALLPLLETRLLRSRLFQLALDSTAVTLSFVVASGLMAGAPGYGAAGWKELAALVPASLFGFWVSGLYRGSYRNAGLAEAARAARAVLAGGILGLAGVLAVFGPSRPALWVIHLYLLLSIVVTTRMSFRLLEYVYQRGRQAERHALILGTGRAAGLALRELLATPELGIVPVGFLDGANVADGVEFMGYPVRSGGEALVSGKAMLGVTDLVVPQNGGGVPRDLRQRCADLGIRVVRFSARWVADDALS